MVKKVFLAAVATLILAAATAPVGLDPGVRLPWLLEGRQGCSSAAP